MRGRILLFAAVALLVAAPSVAQVPQTMSYQGVLTDNLGNLVPDGAYDLTFRIYNVPVAGAPLWTEAIAGVNVDKGGFSVTLGLITPLTLPFDVPYWLGIQVFATPELAPRVRLTPSPYSLSLRLPFTGSAASAGPVMSLDNTGAGPAMEVKGRLNVGTSTEDGRIELHRVGAASATLAAYDFGSVGAAIQLNTENGTAAHTYLEPDGNGTGGFFAVNRNESNARAFEVDGSSGGTEEPRVMMVGSTRSVVFDADAASGNASLAVPTDAISDVEILDEPGIGHSNNSSTLLGPAAANLISRTITCPSAGYVVVLGSCDLAITHVTGSNSYSTIGVSNLSATIPSEQDFDFQIPPGAPSGTWDTGVGAHGVFSVAAGANTFYLVGRQGGGAGSSTAWDQNLTVMFFPTAYGTVSPPGPQEAPGLQQDGVTGGPALSAADITAEQRDAEAFNTARLQKELDAMRLQMDDLQRQLAQSAQAQGVARQAAPARPGRDN